MVIDLKFLKEFNFKNENEKLKIVLKILIGFKKFYIKRECEFLIWLLVNRFRFNMVLGLKLKWLGDCLNCCIYLVYIFLWIIIVRKGLSFLK